MRERERERERRKPLWKKKTSPHVESMVDGVKVRLCRASRCTIVSVHDVVPCACHGTVTASYGSTDLSHRGQSYKSLTPNAA
jgi:hypothetical protein